MSKRPVQPEDLLRFHFLSDPVVSPDGRMAAFTWKTISDLQYRTRIGLATPGEEARPLTQGKSDSMPRWRPDGSELAFVRSDEGGATQIYCLRLDGGEAEPISRLPEGSLDSYAWSPDGRWIALTFRETSLERTQAATKARSEAKLPDLPWVLDHAQYRMDGDGIFGSDRYRLLLLDRATGDASTLCTDSVDGSYDFCWAPDSQRLAVKHSGRPNPYFEAPSDLIRIIDLDGLATEVPGLPDGSKATPSWSPCGEWIAFTANTDPLDAWGTRNDRLYVAKPDGSEVRWLTEGHDDDLGVSTLSDTGAEPSFRLHWLSSGEVVAQVGEKGASHLVAYGLDGTRRPLSHGNRLVLGGAQIAADQTIAVLTADPGRLAEIALLRESGEIAALTNLNETVLSELELAAPEELWLDTTPNKDGSPAKLHAWKLTPAHPNGAAVIEVHGGPHTQYGYAFFHEFQTLVSAGYTVYYSNPRGSKGYGEEATRQIFGDWGHKDWEDIDALTEHVLTDPGIDPARIAIMGGSYGGYMTNWAVGHSKKYRTAITDRCVSNLVSSCGNADFPFNRSNYFGGQFYGSLDRIADLWRQSPIAYFEGVTTPMLVIHSEGDLRCNIEQSEQVFTALQEQGIKSRFVRYPRSTSHGMSRGGPPELRLHRLRQILDWYAETL